MHTPSQPASPSRREFLRTTAAAATALGAASLPFGRSHAQGRTRYRRLNVLDPAARRSLAGYRKAIARMLQLPASDPRNWYRLALTHTMDCPHGNWWFLVWHRGYIGWFEEICRELSGDPEFALPYWDWSANTEPGRPFRASVPDVMFEDVLTPTHPAYIAQFREFHARYRDVLAKAEYWKRTYGPDGEFDDASQYGQLLARGVRSPDDLWFDIIDDPRGAFFFDQAHARGVTRDQPWLDDKTTKAVSLQTLLAALAPLDFITFASPKTMGHSGLTGFGVLEGQPHNRVHNCVGGIFTRPDGVTTNRGGFMQANLSPVDPLFFLHHANIDRIWDVWTRKQQARGYPTLPEGADLDAWSAEPFLFFVDAQGRPVSRTTAGDYATIGGFDYDYQPGSGEEAVPAKAALAAAPGGSGPALRIEHFHARITPAPAQAAAGGTVADAGLLQAGAAPDASALFAQITVALPPLAHGHEFAVLVNAPADAAHPDPASPHYAGTLSMFGHHTVHGPVTFTIPLSGAVAALRAGNLLKTDAPLDIRIVPERRASHGTLAAARDARPGIELLSIVVERHSR